MGPSGAEVIVRPEGLVERGDEIEQSLPADLIAQGVFPVLTALPQPAHRNPTLKILNTLSVTAEQDYGTYCEGLVALPD